MYTGNLIEDLIATVERAEEHAREHEGTELERWYAAAHSSNPPIQPDLLGVA
jgi:hypothetical protein